jgi:hypothetical protein
MIAPRNADGTESGKVSQSSPARAEEAMTINSKDELERRRVRTTGRLDRLRLLELCLIFNHARMAARSISFRAGIQYNQNLFKKYLD